MVKTINTPITLSIPKSILTYPFAYLIVLIVLGMVHILSFLTRIGLLLNVSLVGLSNEFLNKGC